MLENGYMYVENVDAYGTKTPGGPIMNYHDK